MKETVDILLATYNTNPIYLKEQIESILNQTYKEIKLIISDDYSETSKEIKEILDKYKEKDKRITVYYQEKNIGYIKNFEFLLQKSNSNYIMFSDHDDIWYENKVEESVKILKEKQVDLVYCNAKQIDENGKIIHESYFKYKNMPLIERKSNLAISRCIGIGCSQIFTKEVREKIIPFKENVMAHDWLAAFIANENKGIAYIEETLLEYRLHNTNVFGGRSLAQNLAKWKKENGKSYNSYLKYRKEKVIDMAYLDGAKMCYSYSENEKNKKFLENLIKYYEKLEQCNFINFHFIKYFRFLAGKNLFKKMVKEFVIFHLPIIGYITFKM